MSATSPRFYPIVDLSVCPDLSLEAIALVLAQAGVRWVQVRAKQATTRALWEQVRFLLSRLPTTCSVIVNDRADVAALAGAGGVHLGQENLPVPVARTLLGPAAIVGFSTHNPAQVEEANHLPVEYIAVGPVFATATKSDTEPVIGLEQVRAARRATRKPLVAIGGITPENAAAVLAAGADTVAVISGWLAAPDIPRRLEEFRQALGKLD